MPVWWHLGFLQLWQVRYEDAALEVLSLLAHMFVVTCECTQFCKVGLCGAMVCWKASHVILVQGVVL